MNWRFGAEPIVVCSTVVVLFIKSRAKAATTPEYVAVLEMGV
jgi:hypothetical protein